MTDKEYDKAKEECWKAVKKEFDRHYWGEPPFDIFSLTFDRAYALGKQETTFFQNGNTHYSGNHIADVRKMVDTRLNIAAMAMQGILSNADRMKSYERVATSEPYEDLKVVVARNAVRYADALIAECEKGEEV